MGSTLDARLQDLAEATVTATLDRVHTFLPAKVVAFDEDTYSVDVDILVEKEYVADDEDDGETEFVPYARVYSVPVSRFKAGNYSITFPIEVGDLGRVQVPTVSLEEWYTNGGRAQPQDPTEFPVDSSMFIPDLQPDAGRNEQYRNDGAVMAGPLYAFGDKNAPYYLVRADLMVAVFNGLVSELETLRSALVTHYHAGGVLPDPGGSPTPVTGPTFGPSLAVFQVPFSSTTETAVRATNIKVNT